MRGFFTVCTLALLFSHAQVSAAGPWFTGPLLAPAGHTVPNGHTNLEIYGFDTINDGIYSRHWKLIHVPTGQSQVLNPIFTHGITDRMDVQFGLPYVYNRLSGANSTGIGDTSAGMGLQLIEQKDKLWRPDLRLLVQEIIPTGNYKKLDPTSNGVDATGLGSYQTVFSLNFQHLLHLTDVHYFRSRLSLAYVYASPVSIQGLSSYGGTPDTDGNIRPGDLVSLDAAAELTLTQNWVAVMETYIANRQKTRFRGIIGNDAMGKPGTIGHGAVDKITLAPAIEYNFSSNVGIIAGPWFTVAGRETVDFISYVLAFNAYW
ncbi:MULTISPECIES: transporter [Legionella]|uniref:Fe-S protein n=1 Tax=Legionella donaldsonii TaxID=45060 RepID=A0A378JBP8_9GAMM|nr:MULTISPECIES: transporter [Legionella]MCC5015323.1 hypothetical protein [Legionella sp. 31fI33]STX42020.1 Fe-S protein [Legionella donaldsonii]